MIVAVAVPVSPPDQHSPRLGHLASSQTVWSFSSLSFFLICVYFSPPGIDSFIHFGFGSGFFFVPTSTEYGPSPPTNSVRVGDSAARRARRPARVGGKSEEAVVEVCEEEEDEKDRVVDFRVRVRAANRVCILAPESGVRVVREIDSCDGGDSMVRKKMRERLVVSVGWRRLFWILDPALSGTLRPIITGYWA